MEEETLLLQICLQTSFLEPILYVRSTIFLYYFNVWGFLDARVRFWELEKRIETQQTWKRWNYRVPPVMSREEGMGSRGTKGREEWEV